ncbi:hypothetical protein RJ639_046281 [Escallonia herrerae]|uniref:Heat shock protein 70 n=1 Tax=Escallonia herrerae TaxID=1293975 RepID=A0AA88W942_9ASTE|nr:hypothetical protein RJ639_046281 [Escallonia herrerae]
MAEQAYTVVSDSEATGEEKSSSAFPEIAIGIDIGTSQCSVAVWKGSQVELLRNTRNQKLMRSYVTFKDETPSWGVTNQLAHDYEMLSGAAIFNMKRLIGRVDTDPVVNNMWRSTTPEEVLAIYLVELRAMAEVQLKRPVRNVVLTVPVAFSRFQLTRIERACAMAGLHVLRLMPEPTAVALLYGQQQQQTGGVSQIKALAGSTLGGEDILQNMMHHLVPDMDSLFSSRGLNEIKAMGLLRVATQDAIHKLSTQASVQINVYPGNGTKVCKVVDREEFEEVNSKVFEKCEHLITQCLQDAKAKVEDVNDVILVGGCSIIPKIKSVVLGICKTEKIYSGMNPLEAAASGAALEGAVASGISDPFGNLDLLTIQATPLSIGVQADGNSFVPIIHRNTTMPARKESIFTTLHDNQSQALIIVYEGNEETVGKNHLLGYFKITGIPPAPKGVPEINVSMDIDASNVLRVFAGVMIPGTQHPATPFMEARMPTVDDGHGWCAEALHRTYGTTTDLVTLQKKI